MMKVVHIASQREVKVSKKDQVKQAAQLIASRLHKTSGKRNAQKISEIELNDR